MADRKQTRAKRRRGAVDLANALLTLLVIAILVVGGLFLYGEHTFYAAGPIKADTQFSVERGNNLATVAQRLEAQGLIDNRYVFEIGAWANKKQGTLKAGEFKLTANASMADVLKELTEGRPVQHGITIPEGFTIAQVLDRLNNNPDLTGTLTSIPPEGGILPQTYNFEPGVSRQSVLDQMVSAQQKALDQVWAQHDPASPVKTRDQLVILASIVEKETGVPGERPHVAAVFLNRLKKNMRLQSDPTIIYGITKGEAPLGRPLKRSEVETPTPYNTYQIDGLPPTPIDNPGIDALRAVANPDQSDDIYFVAATTNPADGHLFSASYTQHRKNVAKLRAAEQLQAAADATADAAAAEDQLEEQQAAATGDATAETDAATDQGAVPVTTQPAPTTAPGGASMPAAPTAIGSGTPATGEASPATGVPVPMPANQRPDNGEQAAPASDTGAGSNATNAGSSAPAAPASKPATRPTRPRSTQDTFGG